MTWSGIKNVLKVASKYSRKAAQVLLGFIQDRRGYSCVIVRDPV